MFYGTACRDSVDDRQYFYHYGQRLQSQHKQDKSQKWKSKKHLKNTIIHYINNLVALPNNSLEFTITSVACTASDALSAFLRPQPQKSTLTP